jgi:hypothetical protein
MSVPMLSQDIIISLDKYSAWKYFSKVHCSYNSPQHKIVIVVPVLRWVRVTIRVSGSEQALILGLSMFHWLLLYSLNTFGEVII